ncbi:TPA: AAA family ATPase, partial [Pseudomonas aeruginosa]
MAEKDRFADQWEAAGKRPGWRANAVSAASIKPVAIRWLWPGWIAQGKLHILAGAGGTGKTTLLLGLIATITSAGRWPDGERCKEAGNAIIWSSEDDPADTIVPRLAAAGADLRRVHII